MAEKWQTVATYYFIVVLKEAQGKAKVIRHGGYWDREKAEKRLALWQRLLPKTGTQGKIIEVEFAVSDGSEPVDAFNKDD